MTSSDSASAVIWQDSPIEIWNDFQPQTFCYPFSDVYPAFVVIVIFTVIHYLMDKLLLSKAASYANKQININQPKWIESSKYASKLSYKKLSEIPRKKFLSKIKNYELNSSSAQQELISYQKHCSTHSKHISKYLEASFKVLVFGFVYFYGLGLIFVDGKWFWDQKWMWSQGSPQVPGTNPIFNLNIYYFFQIGYHGHRAIYQFFEHSRRDFWAMFIHHWVTVLLLIGSKMVGYQQIGATVLLCNDNCDLLMPLGKLSEYTGHIYLQYFCTMTFCVLWIPLRIGVYFYKVIYSICIDGYMHIRPFPMHWICLVGLIIIYLLQFYWTKYLLEMVWKKLVKGKGIVDVRSDDEDVKSQLKKHN